MDSEELLKEKRAKILHDLVETIKCFLDNNSVKGEVSSKIFIYQRLADFTYYSEVSIRKFLTGTIPKDLASFLNGVKNYCKLIGISNDVVEQFEKEYSEAANTIIIAKESFVKTHHNIPPVDLSSIVIPKKLEDFLDAFIKESINISYIFGYKLSGKTKSVMAYLDLLISRNVFENVVFVDIKQSNNSLKEIVNSIIDFIDIDYSIDDKLKKEECFKFFRKSHSILILDYNNILLDETVLKFIKEISIYTKVILLTSINFKLYEIELSSYSKVFCTNDCFLKDEFERLLRNKNESLFSLLSVEFINKLYRLTGGIPYLGVSILKKIEEENELGLTLNEALIKYTNEKNSLYETFAEKIISDSWDKLDSLAKKILIVVAKFNHSVSLKLIAFILSQDLMSEEWKKSLKKCYEYYLLNSILLQNPRVNLNNMIRTLVLQYEKKEDIDYQEFLNGISKYYIGLANSIGECYNDLEKLKLLDDLDEWEIVQEVLTYLEDGNRKCEYIKIVKGLRYYFYVRGIWQIGEDSILLKSAQMAKDLNFVNDYVELLCDCVNICSKSKNNYEAIKYLQLLEKAVEENHSLDSSVMCLYYHVKGLYLYHCKKDYNSCYKIWKNNDIHYSMNISLYRKLVNELWLTRSYIKIEKDNEKIIAILEEKIKKMENVNFIRAQLDYELLLVGILINEISFFEKSEALILRISKELARCEELLKTKSVKDVRNEAQFFYYKAILATYLHDISKRNTYLEKAKAKYQLMNNQEDILELEKSIKMIEHAI